MGAGGSRIPLGGCPIFMQVDPLERDAARSIVDWRVGLPDLVVGDGADGWTAVGQRSPDHLTSTFSRIEPAGMLQLREYVSAIVPCEV